MPLAESDRRTPIVTLGDRLSVTMDDRPSVTADRAGRRRWLSFGDDRFSVAATWDADS